MEQDGFRTEGKKTTGAGESELDHDGFSPALMLSTLLMSMLYCVCDTPYGTILQVVTVPNTYAVKCCV